MSEAERPVQKRGVSFSIILFALSASFVIRVVAIMTGKAGRAAEILGVTVAAGGAAMIDTPPAFIRDRWMRAGIPGEPVVRGVAGGTVRTEHSSMEDRVSMTTYTRTG
jgi:hypothetical protein